MSEAVMLAIVVSVSGVVTTILSFLMLVLKARFDRNELIWRATNAAILKTQESIEIQGQTIAKIEKHGNSMHEEIVNVTKMQQRALGVKEGVEKEKAEQAVIALARKEGGVVVPGPVIVVPQLKEEE